MTLGTSGWTTCPVGRRIVAKSLTGATIHAATAAVRKGLELAFYEFRVWYRQAADELKAGKKNVAFPPGCFPPGLPFCARPQPP